MRRWSVDLSLSFVSAKSALKPDLKGQWLQIWRLTSRNLSNPNVSRPAAHLLNCILSSAILLNTGVSTLIDTALFSDGLNGPVGMSDAALSLWSTIIETESADGQSAPQQIVIRSLNWISSYFTLCSLLTSLTLFLLLIEFQCLVSIAPPRNKWRFMLHLQPF